MKHILAFFLLISLCVNVRAQEELEDSLATEPFDITLSSISGDEYKTPVNKVLMPRVFNGYRHLSHRPRRVKFPDDAIVKKLFAVSYDSDSVASVPVSIDELTIVSGSVTPDWLTKSIESYRWQEDFIYRYMVNDPWSIQYAYWDLPERPRLPEEDYSFIGYLKRLDVPEAPDGNIAITDDIRHINWLHTFNIALQLSQAYLSGNWYQGGNSYLAFFGNFLWDVLLNQAYYPKTLFQSTVSYKLAINSTPEDKFHKYQISEDLFQYNLKAGYKAYHNWYYSLMAQFKTQFLHNYPVDSDVRTAAFLSPGELNVGVGMTYSKENAAKTLKLSATISPLSYNLKTCIDRYVDPTQFGIAYGHKTLNEIGSNIEVNFFAKFWRLASYSTRAFFFTDYKSIETDWENTLNFQFSKLFSTQIYLHLRYDTKADPSISPKWGKLMLKEILSVGLSYSFSTK